MVGPALSLPSMWGARAAHSSARPTQARGPRARPPWPEGRQPAPSSRVTAASVSAM